MQAGTLSAVGGRGGRHLRFATIVMGLGLLTTWLWTRIIIDVVNNEPLDSIQIVLTATASVIALAIIVSLWRNPVSRNVQMMASPVLRQGLATHHAGHVVATYLQDPTRIRRVDLAQPCHLYRPAISAVAESAFRSELTVTLAGLSAEELFAGESGSHAASDLARATRTGADMVGRYGMSGSLVSLDAGRPRRRRFIARVLDDARTRKELEALLREAKRESVRMMLENRHLIIALRDALTRKGRLDAGQIHEIIAGADDVRHSGDEVLVDLRIVGNRPAAGQM